MPVHRIVSHACLLTSLALVPLAGCGRAPVGTAAASTPRADELQVRRGDFEQVLPLTGEIDAVEAADLRVPRVPNGKATIRSLAQEGAEVKKGDVVAELDSSMFLTQLKEKTLQLSQNEIQLERQASQNGVVEADKALDVELKRAAVKRAEVDADLPPGILPKRDFLEKQLILRRARVELEKAEDALVAQRKTAQVDLAVLRLGVEKLRRAVKGFEEGIAALSLTAPGDGTVILGDHWNEGRKLQEADDAWMGMIVARVSNSTARRVRAWLADVDDGRVLPGMATRVTLDAYPDRVFLGKVTDIAPVAREATQRSQRRVFLVGVDLPGADAAILRPGLSARVDVVVQRKADALLVPRFVLGEGGVAGQKRKVTLASGDTREVTLLGCASSVCAIEGGVSEGGFGEGSALKRMAP